MPEDIAVIGAGPSGLMAAEILSAAGRAVTVYDRMPTPARKLLIAGRGGLNLTHSEPLEPFLTRYGDAAGWLAPALHAFSPADLRAWCEGLGQDTFVGSSGRVFPRSMKAVQLLRAWLARLEAQGVQYKPRHTWRGWKEDALHFSSPAGEVLHRPHTTLLALGGASWPKLGSDGAWTQILAGRGIPIMPLRPANCGFTVAWSEHFRTRFAGLPLKPVSLTHAGVTRQGEAMLTAGGIEGGVVYALSSALREEIAAKGTAHVTLNLRPAMTQAQLQQKLAAPRGRKSFSRYMAGLGFDAPAIGLLHETMQDASGLDASALAAHITALPLTLTGTTGIERAISSAGGIERGAVDEEFMLRSMKGVFVAGEMLDWEAPTGGYLLQACFSTAVAAAHAMLRYQ